MGNMLTAILAQTPTRGGAPVGEIVGASGVALASIAVVAVIGVAHRKRGVLDPFVQIVEERTGRPAWSIVPVQVTLLSLAVAVWGYYWDVSWHIDRGRDEGAFANPAHWFIIIGLDGIAFAAILAMVLGDDRSPSAVKLTKDWKVPVGGIMLSACGLIALAGFPLDDIWHRLFGQDVTAWGPTHIQLIGGASLATLGCWALLVEGAAGHARRAAHPVRRPQRALRRHHPGRRLPRGAVDPPGRVRLRRAPVPRRCTTRCCWPSPAGWGWSPPASASAGAAPSWRSAASWPCGGC